MPQEIENKYLGTLYVIAAPSGAGKTSLVKGLVESEQDIVAKTLAAVRGVGAFQSIFSYPSQYLQALHQALRSRALDLDQKNTTETTENSFYVTEANRK